MTALRRQASSGEPFAPALLTTPTITRYRARLQAVVKLKAASINRSLVSVQGYCAWATAQDLLRRDPARAAKLVAEETRPPRHLTDQQESALLAAVTAGGKLRDRTMVVLLLHTGLRAQEDCGLQREDLRLSARSSSLRIWDKRNKCREVPLNGTARTALNEWLQVLPAGAGAVGREVCPAGRCAGPAPP